MKSLHSLTILVTLLSLVTNIAKGGDFLADTLKPISVIKEYPQIVLPVERGQFSGITWIAESSSSSSNRYAVVDDKLLGGGILFFDIPINRTTGEIGFITATVPDGTKVASGKSQDCEAIAYLPKTNKLLIATERDLSILEYDLKGRLTGNYATIPPYFIKTNLSNSNGGFESLSYNATTQLFWTTTENPLIQDSLYLHTHRLQCFSDSTFEPLQYYLYQTDAPTITSFPSGVKYAFGISDLAALDDGRVIVMEREAYAPKYSNSGNIFELLSIASKMFCTIKLYVVTPAEHSSKDTILKKELLYSFTTNSIYIANYEGLCLGPKLSDGSRCLILIADSQAHQYTTEWLKVLFIK